MLLPAKNHIRSIVIDNGDKKQFVVGSIGINSYISGMYLMMDPGEEIVNLCIGNFCSLSNEIVMHFNRNHDYNSICQHYYCSGDPETDIFTFREKKIRQKGQILIGNDVWIGAGVTLMAGIRIGDGALIGANAVVASDIPPYAIAVGNPARVIRYRFSETQIEKLLKIYWWNWPVEVIRERLDSFKIGIDEFLERYYQDDEYRVRKEGFSKKKILLYPDLNDPYPIWQKVVKEFDAKYNDEEAILILRIDSDEKKQKKFIGEFDALISRENMKKICSKIVVITENIKFEQEIFENVSHYVSTRSEENMMRIQYADKCAVKIISGVDIPVFID